MPSYPVDCQSVNGGDPRGKAEAPLPSPANCPAPRDGDIKLTSYPAGNLLLHFEGAWHPLCSQHLAIETAELMCKALGYTTAWSFSDRTIPTQDSTRTQPHTAPPAAVAKGRAQRRTAGQRHAPVKTLGWAAINARALRPLILSRALPAPPRLPRLRACHAQPGRCFHRCTATRRRARSRPRRSADRTCSTCARSRARTPRTGARGAGRSSRWLRRSRARSQSCVPLADTHTSHPHLPSPHPMGRAGFASSSAHPWLPTSSATAPRRRRRCRPAARPAGPTAAWRPQLTARRWPRCATPSRRDRTVRRRASSAQWAWARLLALRSSRPWVLHTCAGGSGPLACLCEPLQGIYRGDIHTSLPHLATAQPSSTSDHVRMVLERHSHTVVLEPDLEHVLEWREDLAQHRGVALRLLARRVAGPGRRECAHQRIARR